LTGKDDCGAAPTEAAGAEPLTGGNGELVAAWLGSGAGNALCAQAPAAPIVTIAAVTGTIK
jgi:hypothetical protein